MGSGPQIGIAEVLDDESTDPQEQHVLAGNRGAVTGRQPQSGAGSRARLQSLQHAVDKASLNGQPLMAECQFNVSRTVAMP
jgi:hypothetical protein